MLSKTYISSDNDKMLKLPHQRSKHRNLKIFFFLFSITRKYSLVVSISTTMVLQSSIKALNLLLFLLSVCVKPASAGAANDISCIESERQALLKFKQGLVDDRDVLSSWGNEEEKRECCKWQGITCSNGTSRVIVLDLNSQSIRGNYISPALLELQHLNYLDLSYNDFRGNRIPEFFGSLMKLRHLKLKSTNFMGDISSEFGKLANLETLELSYNLLQGGIPKSFGNLSSLTELHLDHNNLSGLVLVLFQNLSGKPQMILETLELSSNQFSGSLPDITGFSSLRHLGLNDNWLNGFLPQSIGQISALEYLGLGYNEFEGQLPDLRPFSSLIRLNISGNRLESLHESIGQLSKLEYLLATSNLLNFTVMEAHLSNLSSLSYLDLSHNNHLSFNLSSQWIAPFQLNFLYLRHCNAGPHFPQWIQTQKSLNDLDISNNSISDAIPDWFWNYKPSMLYLNLSHNQISGSIPDVPSTMSFHVLDLSYNNFLGPIPLFLFRANTLQVSNNKLNGSISHFCRTSNDMIFLDLSQNQLSGELPDCWLKKNRLIILSLANNNFSGKLPQTIGALQQLETMQLRNNNFTGDLPASLKNCTKLRIFDLGENMLTGEIPTWIGAHLTHLKVLSLRSNMFHGDLSPAICQLNNIQILDVSRNNISGKIPLCFNNFTSLVQKNGSFEIGYYMNFSSDAYFNNVIVYWKGQESEYWKLGLLKGIDLSSNRLIGNFPQEFSDLRGLVFLNLSRNQLTGNVISDIGQMEMLEWLDLSRNHFSGEIPRGLASLNYLSVLDLSNNNLTGKIPLGTQLQSFDPSVYNGNKLCGRPLAECTQDAPQLSLTDHDELITREFYFCLVLGFIIGLWVVTVALVLKHSWRLAYFNLLSNIGNWMYVTPVINWNRFTRKFLKRCKNGYDENHGEQSFVHVPDNSITESEDNKIPETITGLMQRLWNIVLKEETTNSDHGLNEMELETINLTEVSSQLGVNLEMECQNTQEETSGTNMSEG